jgi:hypothetical protein
VKNDVYDVYDVYDHANLSHGDIKVESNPTFLRQFVRIINKAV